MAAKSSAIVLDTNTGRVLYSEDPDGIRYPASLTKMMTLYILFEELEKGRLNLNSELTASAHSSNQAPSRLGLRAGEKIRVEDAIMALVTKSANDVAVTIAENISGSEPAFASRMTHTARAIGMTNTIFRNASGLPNPGQHTTARDMATLGATLQTRYPRYFAYFKTRSFDWKGHSIPSHNRLVGKIPGVDGIKTGYIGASGFNLVTSVRIDGHRLVGVVMGGSSATARDQRMARLVAEYLPKSSVNGRPDPNADAPVVARRQAPGPELARTAQSQPMAQPSVAAQTSPPPAPVRMADAPARPVKVQSMVMPPRTVAFASNDQTGPRTTTALPPADIPAESPDLLAIADTRTAAIPPGWQVGAPALPSTRAGLAGLPAAASRTTSLKPVPAVAKNEQVANAEKPKKGKTAPAVEQGDISEQWAVQVGTAGTRDDASALLEKARSLARRAFADADPVTERAVVGGKAMYRARFGGFDTSAEATRACSALRKSMSCYALKLQ